MRDVLPDRRSRNVVEDELLDAGTGMPRASRDLGRRLLPEGSVDRIAEGAVAALGETRSSRSAPSGTPFVRWATLHARMPAASRLLTTGSPMYAKPLGYLVSQESTWVTRSYLQPDAASINRSSGAPRFGRSRAARSG